MDERSRVLACAVAGAAAGALFGYFYLTESGRRLRAQIDPAVEDFVQEVRRLRSTVERAKAAADESWRSLNEIVGGEAEPRWQPAVRPSASH